MKYFFAILLLAGLPAVAHADMIPDNYHSVDSCLKIDNLADYSNYDFMVYTTRRAPGTMTIDADGVCGLGGSGKLLAVRKADEAKITSGAQADCPECGDNWPDLAANKQYIAWSSLAFTFDTDLPDTNSITKEETTVHIDGVSGQVLDAHLVTSNENSTSVSAASGDDYSLPISLGITVLAAGTLGVIIGRKTWKK